MKTSIFAVSALALSATAAAAGGPVVVVDAPAVYAPVAATYDWSGAYVGLGYGVTSGDLAYTPGGSFDLDSGSATSIFAGYQMQNGSFVYGGELAYSKGSKTFATGFPNENVSRMVDLKAKLGYSLDRAMVYGILGYSSLNYDIPGSGNFNTNGVNYGLGVDFAVSQNFIMGMEYLVRNTSGDTFNAGQSADLDVNTFSLRVAYKF